MTKRMGVSSRNWFEGSQVSKARPGAPFDFTLRYRRGHRLSRLASASRPGAPFDCVANVNRSVSAACAPFSYGKVATRTYPGNVLRQTTKGATVSLPRCSMQKFGQVWTIAIFLTAASTLAGSQAVHQPLPGVQSRSAAQEPLA